MTRRYEVVYIFNSALEEAQIDERLTAFHDLLKSDEAPEPVKELHHWGKRTLAYPIKGKEVGHYTVAQFESSSEVLPEFERAIKLEEGVLRYLLVVNEGEAAQPVVAGGESDDSPKRSD